MDASVLAKKPVSELKEIAEALQLKAYKSLRKAELIDLIVSGGAAANGEASSDADTDDSDSSSDFEDSRDPSDTSDSSETSESSQDSADSSEQSPDAAPMTSADRVRARRRAGGNPTPAPEPRPQPEPRNRGEATDRAESAASPRPPRARIREDVSTKPSGERSSARAGGDDRADSADGEDRGEGRSRNRSRNRSKRGRNGETINFDELEVRRGVLDLLPEGYGFLRTTGYLAGDRDVYVSQAFVRRNQLRRGDVVEGPIRYNKGNDKFPALARIDSIEGEAVEQDARPEPRPDFKDLTPLFPDERLTLGSPDGPVALRLLDLLVPIGKGQRGLLLSPPRAGKTTMLKAMAKAVARNHPDVELLVLLLDERPEEVTEFERSTECEVISSTFDRPSEDHAQIAELTIERAKRLVERGRDVVVLVDSLTRLGRAHSLIAPASGRTLAEGLDSAAINPPKRFFGAARKVEEGGSLTIVAVADLDSGSQLDEAILEEFIGTCNMQLRLDGDLARKRLFPAIDVLESHTKGDDRLLGDDERKAVAKLRRTLGRMEPDAALELLLDKLESTSTNEDFLAEVISDVR